MLALPIVLAAAVVVSTAPSPQLAPEPIAIPIAKREQYLAIRAEPTVNLAWLLATKAATTRKYGSSMNPDSPIHNATSVSTPSKRAGNEALTYQTSLWTGPIILGGQKFQINFDTGSSDLWVPAKSCNTGGCVGHTKYTKSSTATVQKGTFQIMYGDGTTSSGPIYKENLSIGGISVTQQAFSPVTAMDPGMSVANGDLADGMAGMGFQSGAQTGFAPFFQTMMAQGKVPNGSFSFRLGKTNSELYLGGANPAQYTGSFTYASLKGTGVWKIPLGGIQVSGKTVATTSNDAIIDTGTTLAYSSYAVVKKLWTAVPGAFEMSAKYGSDFKGYYAFPCSSKPTMSFMIGGKYFTIPAAALNTGPADDSGVSCVGAVIGQDGNAVGLGDTWLLGDVFMTNFYTTYDVKGSRIGFATLK